MRKQTKAERIFKDTYTECRLHVKRFGYEGYGFTGMITKGDELVYTRTANEIKRLIESEARSINFDRRLGFSTEEYLQLRTDALNMVRKTLENQYIA